ncbi:MAG TPA: outer membrane beta-barrel protein [Xanthobacteraceae bacterium]|jgi:outer membrane immunogenic protein
MKKVLLVGAALAGLAAGQANAADLARPTPVYRAPPPPVTYFTWTGCYIGGNGGWLWARKDWSNDVAIPALGAFPPAPAGASFSSHDVNGGVGGVQGGCNYQVSNWVFGIQGDYDWSGASGSNNNVLFPFVAQSNIRSLASVTGRVGYAWARFLLYAKGGGAWSRDEYSMTATALVPGFTVATASETRSGWTVGIGGEYAFLDWLTGFAEYDYYGFGTNQNTFGPCGVIVCGAATTLPVDVKENVNVFKAGLNFKFGPTAPLVGRY